MNPRLTKSQQRTICSELGSVKLQLLYKASVHGFTGAAFHQRCDSHSPTVSVGYNSSGFVFGGYTKQPFSQSGQYVYDDQAFIFTFSGEKLLKYPVTGPANAVKMIGTCGPYFGESLVLVNGSQAVAHSNPGNYYPFNAAKMHGNNLTLTECEVYQVEESREFENPWRPIVWETKVVMNLLLLCQEEDRDDDTIRSYSPMASSVSQVRVLLIGPVGAGKSSFFNSINSVFRGHVTSQAIAGSSATSLTTQVPEGQFSRTTIHHPTMNPRLTKSQRRAICFELGRVKIELLYKASVHGFTGAAFHQRCDRYSPTVTVGYNSSGFVFGGYTKQPFSQSGQYVYDDQAFIFTFSGEKLLKYPVTGPAKAVKMIGTCGPYFGETLVLVHGSEAAAYSNPGNYYHFNAAEMHGNNLTLTECEVYEVEERPEFERPWRPTVWETKRRTEMMDTIRSYSPMTSSVSQVRVLLIGPVGAGKSSFFNSINSVFRGHVTSQAIAGSSATSLTTQFRTYSVKAGRGGKPLPIILCDTMGLEENTGAGLDIDDIVSILKGHLPDTYQFNPSAPLHAEAHCYRKSPGLKDRIHCVAYVVDACKVSIMPTKLEEKLEAIRRKVNLMGIPQLIMMTKVDEACPFVSQDVRNVYRSGYIKEMEVSARLGVPLSCVVPVKNYSEELELDPNCDILLLSTVIQMLRFADNYFDELSDRLSNMEIKG